MPIMPVIALWVVHLGGTASTLGFAAAAFSLTSFALRPLIGRLCDTWSTRGIFALGCLVSGAGSLLIMVPSLPVLYISQAINGLGWAAINTGGNTMVAELAPAHRRGAASGYYMLARGTMGFYLPFVALHLKDRYGYWLPFLLTAVAGLLAAPLVIGISERKRTRDRASMAAEESRRREGRLFGSFLDRGSMFPSALLFLSMLAASATWTFIVLYAKWLGIGEGDIARLFLIQGAFGIVTQGLLAGLSDRVGRGPVIALGFLITAAGTLILSQASGFTWLTVGMVISSIGPSMAPAALQAMAIDRAAPERRGAAMATFSLSFQFGSFIGGLSGGLLIDAIGYRSFFVIFSVPALFALALLISGWRKVSAPPLVPVSAGEA
jgi:MFS family permease